MKSLEDVENELDFSRETRYPNNGFFTGPEKPCRFEAEVYNCSVRGQIPKPIDGTYYRVMPDSLWGPLYDNDVFINGDGCINAVRIRDGHADFKSRYVRTEKFLVERAARQAVYGRYRNRYTDDPRVKHRIHSTANTHIIYYENQLLALKEDSKPYAMDPDTLETKGYYDFHGQYGAPTHTAHPKIDPVSGEMATMGYQAKGEGTTDVAYYLFDKHGQKLTECWVNAPYSGMMHDFATTKSWIIFPMPPLRASSVDELKRGDKAFAWDNDKPLVFGLLPRHNPKPENVRWFHYKNAFFGHIGNAFDGDDGCVYLDAPITYGNKFWFFPPRTGDPKQNIQKFKSHYVRWRFDPNATDFYVEPQVLVELEGEMPRVDDRFASRPYSTIFLAMFNKSAVREDAVTGGSYNSVAACNVKDGTYKFWSAGPDVALHEVAFVPRTPDAPEADGWLITFANRRDTMLSSIFILDTATLSDGPVAIIELPFRLRAGIHGTWVPADDLPEHRDLCDMTGVSEAVRGEFEGTTVGTPFPSNAPNVCASDSPKEPSLSNGTKI